MRKILVLLALIATFGLGAMNQAMAYVFSATGITVESTDVSNVSGVTMNAIGSQYEILKFLGLFLLVGVAGFILSKILGIKIGGGSNGQ